MNLGATVMSTSALIKVAGQREDTMSKQIVLDLTKKLELNLTKAGITQIPILQTRAAIDRSGSMTDNFKLGFVEKAVDLFTVAALKFDDNASLELGFFNSSFQLSPEAQEPDVGQYMKTKGKSIYASGGTAFSPIISHMESKLKSGMAPRTAEPAKPKGWWSSLVEKVTGSPAPVISGLAGGGRTEPDRGYVGIITDGACASEDKRNFESKLDSTSGDTFFQFIGIGSEVDRAYLDRIAGQYKHVAVFYIDNPLRLDDDKFYELVCNPKFVSWCNVNG